MRRIFVLVLMIMFLMSMTSVGMAVEEWTESEGSVVTESSGSGSTAGEDNGAENTGAENTGASDSESEALEDSGNTNNETDGYLGEDVGENNDITEEQEQGIEEQGIEEQGIEEYTANNGDTENTVSEEEQIISELDCDMVILSEVSGSSIYCEVTVGGDLVGRVDNSVITFVKAFDKDMLRSVRVKLEPREIKDGRPIYSPVTLRYTLVVNTIIIEELTDTGVSAEDTNTAEDEIIEEDATPVEDGDIIEAGAIDDNKESDENSQPTDEDEINDDISSEDTDENNREDTGNTDNNEGAKENNGDTDGIEDNTYEDTGNTDNNEGAKENNGDTDGIEDNTYEDIGNQGTDGVDD